MQIFMHAMSILNFSCVTNDTISPCNTVAGSANLFTGEVAFGDYGYNVNKVSAYAFLVLFAVTTSIHIALGVYHRTLFTFLTLSSGGAIEAIGWGGRFWSVKTTFWDPNQGGQWVSNDNGFTVQIICLVIAPTFFSAANYIILGRLLRQTGNKYSSLTARSFSILFTILDVVCLVVQGVGGGIVGGANTDGQTATGLHVMASGVVLQVVLTVVFIAFYAEFAVRIIKDQPRQPRDLFRRFHKSSKVIEQISAPHDESYRVAALGDESPCVVALGFATLLILLRGLFRCDELLCFSVTSTTGAFYNQNLFIGMDASLMLALLVTYLVVHPALHS